MAPLISIVIPLYNKEQQIGATIESVLRQTYRNFEIIVINDGSTDRSLDVVRNIQDSRIRIFSQSNGGVSVARNHGIEKSEGEYIAFLDADDEWHGNYLESQVKLIGKYPECGVFACAYEYKDENNVIIPAVYRGIRFVEQTGILDNYFEVASKSAPPIWTSAVMVRKRCFENIGGFMPGVATGEDLLLWARLAASCKIAFNRTPLAQYNLPSTGTFRKDPKDMSLKNDLVRRELIMLYRKRNPDYLRLYLSFWDKMRAVINIKKGEHFEGIRYAFNAICWNVANYKAYLLLILSITPTKISNRILR